MFLSITPLFKTHYLSVYCIIWSHTTTAITLLKFSIILWYILFFTRPRTMSMSCQVISVLGKHTLILCCQYETCSFKFQSWTSQPLMCCLIYITISTSNYIVHTLVLVPPLLSFFMSVLLCSLLDQRCIFAAYFSVNSLANRESFPDTWVRLTLLL